MIYVWEDTSVQACWNHFFHMDLALWGQSYFIVHILITCLPQEMANMADGDLSHPPRSSVLTEEGSSWWLPNNWLCCTWAQKLAFGKALFTGRAKNSSFHMKVKFCSVMSYFVNPWDVVHGILQARILEWVACPFSRGLSQPRDRTKVSHTAGRFFTSWATREAQVKIN